MSTLVSLGVCCALLWWVVRAKRACGQAPAPQARPNLSSAAPPNLEPQLSVVPRPSTASPMPFQAFVASSLTPPGRILGLASGEERDLDLIRERFNTLFWNKQLEGAAENELLVISYAYLIMLLAAKARSMTVTVQAAQSNTFNIVNQNNLQLHRELVQINNAREAQTVRADQAELELNEARVENARLQVAWREQQEAAARREARLAVLRERAKFAPPWFDQLTAFLNTRCVRGPDERVSSAEVHDAFARFLAASPRGPEPPTQRELRQVLEENLNCFYTQVFVNGSNARGFKGLGLCLAPTDAPAA